MLGEHLDPETEDLPPIPLELRVSIYISRQEEMGMGVEAELTDKYRRRWKLPESDAPEEPAPDTATAHPASSPIIAPISRKRAYSVALSARSTSTTVSRLPPFPKIIKP
jgi:hypothetical protein